MHSFPQYHQILTPDYDVGCKRRIFDTDWYPSLVDPRLELTTLGLESINNTAATLAPSQKTHPSEAHKDGREIPCDIIILANGFEVSGRRLKRRKFNSVFDKRGAPQMYKGTALDGFLNFLLCLALIHLADTQVSSWAWRIRSLMLFG